MTRRAIHARPFLQRSSLGLATILLAACSATVTNTPKEAPDAASEAPAVDDGEPPVIEGDRNLLANGQFDDGSRDPWMVSLMPPARGTAAVKDGALCLQIDERGYNSYDAQLRHRHLPLIEGRKYRVSFTARANRKTQLRPKVGMVGPPYTEYWAAQVEIGPEPKTFSGHFLMRGGDDKTAELTFHAGGPLATEGEPTEVCIDEVALDDPKHKPYRRAKAPRIRLNQVGYFPGRSKLASVEHASTSPLGWQLLDADKQVVGEGTTSVFGDDLASGDHLHWIDFSSFKTPGEGYRLRVGEETSDAFAVGDKLYAQMKVDALRYFYHNRSGLKIVMPFAGDKKWARPAGHLADKSMRCLDELKCNYTLDVSGGWYDAGDHGKYVVNGGISVWTLLNLHERTQHLGRSLDSLGDRSLNIPESGNGVSDLLDEARWGLELFLRMQVPQGKPFAGMAHHKVHGDKWTGLPLMAHEDKTPRHLHAPSTTATLNLAANAAQAARIWREIDPAFASRCLTAAKRAWQAAKENPDKLPPSTDNVGGGPYDDKSAADEFYWAAAELYVTTGDEVYREAVLGSKLAFTVPSPASGGAQSAMTWQDTRALGTISLAVVPSGVSGEERKRARDAIGKAADVYAAIIEKEGYRLPLSAAATKKYPWGSNSLVLNNMIIFGLSYDFSRNKKHLEAMAAGMDYLLGRNPMAQSYVTGYGTRPLRNPHHRFWAQQLDQKYPEAPPGAVSGGPNSDIQDPRAKASGLGGCAPQQCFVDHIEAWSVNEVTINWNAPFAWVAAYLDERGND